MAHIWKRGIDLTQEEQREVLAAYVHRFTGDHWPNWAKSDKFLQFRNDHEWLKHTSFRVKLNGRLDKRVRGCMSNPTWPNRKVGAA